MSLGSMTSALVLMGLLAAAVVAVSLLWLLPVAVLGTSTRVLADDTNQAEADPLLAIFINDNQLFGAFVVANLASCLYGSDGLGGSITIVTCSNTAASPLSSCATGVTAVNAAATTSGGNQPTYARVLIRSETDRSWRRDPWRGGCGDVSDCRRPCKGSVRPIQICRWHDGRGGEHRSNPVVLPGDRGQC